MRYYFITAPDRNDLYWRPNRQGYTINKADAGLYNEVEAQRIVSGGRGDRMVHVNRLMLEEVKKYREEDIAKLNEMLEIVEE